MDAWLHPIRDLFKGRIQPIPQDPARLGPLVEVCVATHYRPHFPTFYIKAEGEVDVAYLDEERFWPVEVKWTGQLRPKALKQIPNTPMGGFSTGRDDVG